MSTYERVTYRLNADERAKSAILRTPVETSARGISMLVGNEVDIEGTLVGRIHLISLDLVEKRVKLVMNLHYGKLEEE